MSGMSIKSVCYKGLISTTLSNSTIFGLQYPFYTHLRGTPSNLLVLGFCLILITDDFSRLWRSYPILISDFI